MKHCRKSYPGPECLDARLADQPEGNWNDFRNELWDCYCAVRDRLRDDQRGLCAYCEMDLTDDNRQIAHFHPKGDNASGHNLALDWANLWFACKGGTQTWMQDEDKYLPTISDNSSCDERKGGLILDGHILAPNEVPAFPRIFRYEQGLGRLEIHPDDSVCADAGLDPAKVRRTIHELNLNCKRLARARNNVREGLDEAIAKLREAHVDDPHSALQDLVKRRFSENGEGRWPRFFTLIRWRFGQVAESYLQSIQFNG